MHTKPNIQEVERWLYSDMQAFAVDYYNQPDQGRKYITNAILERIAHYGKDHYHICVGGFKGRYDGGWLYDLIWYDEDENDRLKSLELALEVEQLTHLNDIKYDFEKLLNTNARIKVMICIAYQLSVAEIKNYFDAAVASYELIPKGTRFYALIWDKSDSKQFYDHVIVKQ